MLNRNLPNNYFLDPEYSSHYDKYGYVVVKNILSNAHIERILNGYKKIVELTNLSSVNSFLSSVSLGSDSFSIGINTVNSICLEILPTVLNVSKCDFNLGGSILIKGKGCYLPPHQGTPLVIENDQLVSYIWMPTESVGKENGTFMAIPGSHKWAAIQRSSQHEYWPFNPFIEKLNKLMVPIFVEKGDILIFDSALIHASLDNFTNHYRIAANATIVPKEAKFVQYVELKFLSKFLIKKYIVDRDYWISGKYNTAIKNYKYAIEFKQHTKFKLGRYIDNLLKESNIQNP